MAKLNFDSGLTEYLSDKQGLAETVEKEVKEGTDLGAGGTAGAGGFDAINRPAKIASGGVLQYPIDLDTDIQDYFEIQIFKYRPAKALPNINSGTENTAGGVFANSNLRGLRQNQRLQELQSTIQLPIPNSVKDQNAVGWGGGEMSGVAGSILGPVTDALFGGGMKPEDLESREKEARGILNQIGKAGADVGKLGNDFINLFDGVIDVAAQKSIRRRNILSMVSQLTNLAGVNINVNQAIGRFGAVENPNLELLITGPSLRSFSFTIRLTPRSPEESKKVRMIIRALKQSMAIKKGQQLFQSDSAANLLLGTPDVFKLRYIKARTQKDIKGLNKFKTCALQNMSVDYTGEAGRFAAYDEDSQPVTSIITLSFSELVPIYDTDYVEFALEDDNVGL